MEFHDCTSINQNRAKLYDVSLHSGHFKIIVNMLKVAFYLDSEWLKLMQKLKHKNKIALF